MGTCSTDNTSDQDQTSFWSSDGIDWDAHRIGWAIAGGCAALTFIISLFSALRHMRNYTNPAEQRQIIRIIYMPPVFAIISFFSYRYFRDYTYYELIEVIYEAITISAFMLLLIEYVGSTSSEGTAKAALERKDKKRLPLPFCCWRFRPTKAYFMYTMKWAVMQYVVIRPIVSIAGIICQALNVLCDNDGLTDFTHAYPYLSIVDFISISIALYGLLMFYNLTKEELKEKKPLGKFLCIKLIVFFTFYQSFVFSALEGKVIKATKYWTETNIADGLNALCTCIEMVLFSIAMIFCYSSKPYVQKGVRTSVGRAFINSLNFSDFVIEIWSSVKFFIDYYRGKPGTHTGRNKPNFGEAFGFESGPGHRPLRANSTSMQVGGYANGGAVDMRNYSAPKTGQEGPGGSSEYMGYSNANGGYPGAGVGRGAYNGGGGNYDNGYGGYAAQGYGRGGSMEMYGENVRLTTFTPGSTAGFVNGGERTAGFVNGGERTASPTTTATGMRGSNDTADAYPQLQPYPEQYERRQY